MGVHSGLYTWLDAQQRSAHEELVLLRLHLGVLSATLPHRRPFPTSGRRLSGPLMKTPVFPLPLEAIFKFSERQRSCIGERLELGTGKLSWKAVTGGASPAVALSRVG